MSLTKKKTAKPKTNGTVKAARRAKVARTAAAANAASAAQNAALAAQNAAVVAKTAARSASGAAQTTAITLNKELRERVYTARSWAAPRLDSAADYCTTTAAPKVSSALRTTARQITPPDRRGSKRSSILTWSLLGAAILAALGAVGALVRYRYHAAIAADTEGADEEVMADSTDSQAAPVNPDGTRSAAGTPTGQSGETSVNGRVTASGW